MNNNINKIRLFGILAALATCGTATAQQVTSPCPEVLISEKYDHVPYRQYRSQGWDTVVTCDNRQIELTAESYIPVQYFNGTYLVEQIPYNPPDTTFYLNYNATIDANNPYKKKMGISTDDDFAPSAVNIPYPFYFFGIRKNSFVLGANGLVTFNASAANQGCPWSYSAAIPWTDNTSGAPSPASLMRDAIYGVYEDTYPSPSINTSGDPNWGIYYGVLDTFPCRKIICSWNDVPQYNCTSLHCTYQIVCYEGSNIIEVHVKQRQVCTNWQNGVGLIGIQNATGQPQVKSNTHGDPNYYVVNGSPAAFYPTGYNTTNQSFNNIAFRFTPQGTTRMMYSWYRLVDGQDSIPLSTDINDTNGYYEPMNESSTTHPTLTRAFVSPKEPTKYVCELRFKNANDDWYFLKDTIFVGIDTANELSLHLAGAQNPQPGQTEYLDICQGATATASLSYPNTQQAKQITWRVSRMLNGEEIVMPTSLYGVDGSRLNLTLMSDPRSDTLPTNKIDSIYIQASVDFVSECRNYGRVLVRIFPNFDTTEYAYICRGENYTWNPSGNHPRTFNETTDPQVVHETLSSQPGCDSIVRLALTVLDVSHTTEHIQDCKPVTWKNGRTYTQSNTGGYDTDIWVTVNRAGCDSVVHLDLTIHPLTARLQSSLDHFDYDHLDVELTDISTGGDSRRWKFPTAADQTGATAYYTIPASLDQAEIKLIAHSPYGCVDSTSIVLPLEKENFWMPNIFTPDDPAGNNIFSSISSQTVRQEMFIYNRFGQLVYHCEGVDCGWDGRDNKGRPCPQGAYAYVIRFTNTFQPDVTQIRKGSVTLLR